VNKYLCGLVLQLNKETEDATLLEKITVYQRANKEVRSITLDKKNTCIMNILEPKICFPFTVQVAIICNHQRAVSKSHDSQITKLNEKIDELKVCCSLQMIRSNICFPID
jgi:DNA topoisomerase-1